MCLAGPLFSSDSLQDIYISSWKAVYTTAAKTRDKFTPCFTPRSISWIFSKNIGNWADIYSQTDRGQDTGIKKKSVHSFHRNPFHLWYRRQTIPVAHRGSWEPTCKVSPPLSRNLKQRTKHLPGKWGSFLLPFQPATEYGKHTLL